MTSVWLGLTSEVVRASWMLFSVMNTEVPSYATDKAYAPDIAT